MGKTIEWFTKKKLVTISLYAFIIFCIFYGINMLSSCRHEKYCSSVTEIGVIYLLPFISIFIFSLITLKLKESTFKLWKIFSFWVIPIFLIIISLLPTRTHGLDVVSIVKGTAVLFLTILYSITSLLLIIYKSIRKE